MLVQRNILHFDEAKAYFRPELSMLHDPFLMKDMDKAVSRITNAFSAKEKILVFGDYDVDGTTAVALMYSFLSGVYDSSLVDFYIPHRYREGYGVSKAGIDHAAESGYSLIICLDCGIKSVELIRYAKTLGIDFIVCDHHLPGNELPEAVAILNAKQVDCNYPFKELCGCGVGFKLISALAKTLHIPEEICFRNIDLIATAIAADIVPMNGENRILAFYGLKKINDDPSPGIKALMHLGGIEKAMTITNVVFVLAPRVNAAGRMDDARKAVLLFIEKDAVKAMELAEQLNVDNSDRKLADSSITEEALAIILADKDHANKKSSVIYREHWHKGVVGIVASRLMEHYYRPTIVLTKSGDLVAGSARSVQGFNLYEAIYECREHLLAYGGHYAAAGLSMLPGNVEAFTDHFDRVVSSTIAEHLLIPEIRIDAEITLDEIRGNLYNIICQMEPFGPENMRPVFISKKVIDCGSRVVKEKHLKMMVGQNDVIISGIGFNMAEYFSIINSGEPFDIVYTLDENEWNGNRSIQIKIIDIRASE
jgi:single-stranded-DNA-specific exonuclease